MENSTPTPPTDTEVTSVVPVADPAAELKAQNEQLKKQLADKESFIANIKSEKETLEARISQTQQPRQAQVIDSDLQREASRILESAQIDPVKAGEELANLIKATQSKTQQEILSNLQPMIDQSALVQKVRDSNQDLIDLGLEPSITIRANQLINSGKSIKDALDLSVSEARSKVDKLKSKTPSIPTPPPAGSVGEAGSNRQPEPPAPPKEDTEADEIRAEQDARRKRL
jgi:hypothetical protein